MDDVAAWIQAHGPADIMGRAQTQALGVRSPVVERALESVWGRINVGSGIAHPLDKHTVIDTFRILRKAGEPYDAAEVRAWLVRKGMHPKAADDIAAIAENPSGFRSSARATSGWRSDILNVWRGKAD